MKIFFTSEASGSYGEKANIIYSHMSKILSKRLESEDYGSGLSEWFLIFIIMGGKLDLGYKERTKYSKKNQEIDFRLRIDFDSFKKGNTKQRTYLLYECMKRSLDIMEEKKIPNFNISRLKVDFETISEEQGWSRFE